MTKKQFEIVRMNAWKGLAAMAVAAPIHASVLDEVIVTAQKREQSSQDVGIAVSALSGEQVEQLGFITAIDVAGQTPGLITTNAVGSDALSIFALRGIAQADFNENQEGPVAVYEDEGYFAVPSMSGVPMYDLERVEVLLGPQGTLFGRNATGGLIHFITAKPTDEFEAYFRGSVGNYGLRKGEGAISGPLTDSIQGRFSFRVNKRDGYIDNKAGSDARQDDSKAFRGQLLFQLTENTDIIAKVYGDSQDEPLVMPYEYRASEVGADGVSRYCTGCGFLGSGTTDGNGIRTGSYNLDPSSDPSNPPGLPKSMLDRELYGATFNLKHRADAFTLTWITDYKTYNRYYGEDADGTDTVLATYISENHLDQVSQEIRLDGEATNYTWITGLYYIDVDADFNSGFAFPPTYIPEYFASQQTKSYGLFAQIDYDISDALTLTVGGRWMTEEKDMDYVFTCNGGDPFCDPIPGFLQDLNPRKYSRDDDLWGAKLGLNWSLDSDNLVYVTLNRGAKGGGFNAPLDGFLVDELVPFEPEEIIAFEVGYKSSHFDGAMQFNVSSYYYDYKDYQAFLFSGTTSNVVSHDAEIYGAEASIQLIPAEGWDILAGVSIANSTVEDVAGLGKDQDALLAPDLTANLLVRKEWDLGDNGSLALQLDSNYVGEREFNTVNSPVTRGESYVVTNARIQFSNADSRWEVGVYAKNITDEDWLDWTYDISSFANMTLQVYNPPRMYGLDVKYSF